MRTKFRKQHKTKDDDDISPHYEFDYKAKPNRFTGKSKEGRLVVIIDEDVAKVFNSPESVNKVLPAVVSRLSHSSKRKTVAN